MLHQFLCGDCVRCNGLLGPVQVQSRTLLSVRANQHDGQGVSSDSMPSSIGASRWLGPTDIEDGTDFLGAVSETPFLV